jgi:peroxiredoxin Q/BCP
VVNVQPTIEEGSEGKSDDDTLVVGSILPKITLQNEKGDDVNVFELVKETGIVIFAAPKADTRAYIPPLQ